MSNAKLIETKRNQVNSLIETFMVSTNNSTKASIRKDIQDLWGEIRLLKLEDKINENPSARNSRR